MNAEKLNDELADANGATPDKGSPQNKNVIKEVLAHITATQPKQTEKEIFVHLDKQGYNNNPSEQSSYPGVQQHPVDESQTGDTAMPYRNHAALPENVRAHLPEQAQEIYREAFNHALEEYQDPAKRRDNSSLEETAHKVAWGAVKNKYEKDASSDTWKLKNK